LSNKRIPNILISIKQINQSLGIYMLALFVGYFFKKINFVLIKMFVDFF